jgi:hypothetical protein
MVKPARSSTASNGSGTDRRQLDTPYFSLDDLELDGNNPRLGAKAGTFKSQTEVLDAIVDTFGVDDVLSSLAVNGFFEAEPLVGVRDGKKIRIAEGNRRLAACLILAGDQRARNHQKRTLDYQALQKKYKRPAIEEIPIRVLTDTTSLLSYLGVRHIAASQPWDSYAKAAWVAEVLRESDLSLTAVTEMIGDQHKTVARALEGFYFVNQLISAAEFEPGQSLRPGRGSNPSYPFSWVYTALGYGPVREWLELNDLAQDKPSVKPLKKDHVSDGGELMSMLFGNKAKSRQAAITDSRQIADLARAIANPESRRLLKRGKSITEVASLLRPPFERVSDCLYAAQESLQDALTPLSQGEIKQSQAADLIEPAKKVKNLGVEINGKIAKIVAGTEE